MVRPSDVLVLLALQQSGSDWTLRSLADRLGVKHSKVQRAVDRLERAGLYDERRRTIVPHAAEEFLLHALKYLQPIREGAPTRGVPTAWAALPLSDEIVTTSDLPPVWPDPHGSVRGVSVEPLDDALPRLVSEWPEVAEMAALVDALRLGDARVREAATRHLRTRLAVAS
jgi:DNA-binding transcriptional MocR family regulator